jgi:hypothetical protein
MKNNLLNNVENYQKQLDESASIIFIKYIALVHEILDCSDENIFLQNINYLKYILISAVKNTFHIYSLLLLYTKNLELTIYHTQKSILYYIEFISQIGEDNHSFLKLTSKDATLFTFKKTIFEINNDYKKTFEENDETKIKFKILHEYCAYYNSILFNYIEHYDFKNKKIEDLKKDIFSKLYNIIEIFIQIPIVIKKNNIKLKNDKSEKNKKILNKLIDFNKLIICINEHFNIDFVRDNYLYFIEILTKKALKYNIDIEKIKYKLNQSKLEQDIKGFTVNKIINYLFS